MNQNKHTNGFTLMELMIAILVIGILASFAVPEYKKALEHVRASEAVSLLRALYVGEEAYFLAYGEYAPSLDSLDLTFYGNKVSGCTTSNQLCAGYYNTEEIWGREWAVGLEAGKNPSISVMRLNGPYVGTGFFMQLDRKDGVQYPLRKFACVESNVGKKKYTGKSGSYCIDMMDGSYVDTPSKVRKYEVVW